MITFRELLEFFGLVRQSRHKAYSNYLESFRWFIVRHARIAMDFHRCASCGSFTRLQVHHPNYTYMGLRYSFWRQPLLYLRSMLMEILTCQTLCNRCHWHETVKQREQ